jgi:DNA-binding SARP family transcriptional activator
MNRPIRGTYRSAAEARPLAPQRGERLSRPSEPHLSVSVFGAVTASFRGKPVDLKLRKAAAILAYLCLQENLVARRDRLAFLMWSESENDSARTSLRQTLITLRRAFRAVGYDGFETTKMTVGLDPRSVDVDFHRIVAATEEGRLDETLLAVERLPETLMEGMEDLDEEFRMWLLPTRQALHNRLERLLSTRLNDPATPDEARGWVAKALLRIDPTNEAALQHEVLSYAQRGDVISALRSYRRFETLLADEYELKPSVQLQMLINRIQRQSAEREASLALDPSQNAAPALAQDETPASGGPAGRRHTVVIRLDPFTVQGIDASKGYLIAGFRHTLTASLVRFREWVIVDGAQEAAIARAETEIDYALQATLYEVDGAIEVVLTLLRMQDSRYLWSQIIRLQLDKWLATQHDIIRGLASTLQIHVSAERLSRSVDQTEISVTAFDQWLRAQAAAFSLERDRLNDARQSLVAVARSNPTYSPIFSALAQLNNVESMVRPGIFRDRLISQMAVDSARRAVQLDAVDSRAHLALGWAYAFRWEFEAATPHMRLAVELNESDPWPTVSVALFWAFANEMDKALEGVEAILGQPGVISPVARAYIGKIYFLSGNFASAIAILEDLNIAPTPIAAWLAAAMGFLGRTHDAANMARKFVNQTQAGWEGLIKPTEQAITSWLVHAYPFRNRAQWERMREGLRLAKLPVQHLRHSVYSDFAQRQNVDV